MSRNHSSIHHYTPMSLNLDTEDILVGHDGNTEDHFSCPFSTLASFTSFASLYGQVNPGRSSSSRPTPYERVSPVGFESSFRSMDMAIDLTPAPPSLSDSFTSSSMTMRTNTATPVYISDGLSGVVDGVSFPSMSVGRMEQLSSTQSVGMFCDSPSSSPPFMVPTPVYPPHAITNGLAGTMWSRDNGPITFSESPSSSGQKHMSPAKREPLESQPATYGRRILTERAQQSTTALARIQISQTVQSQKRSSRRAAAATTPNYTQGITKAPRATSKCEWPGCVKSFRRPEHYKRHMDTVHLKKNTERCPAPGCGKKFHARVDNFKTHVERHINPGPSAKTKPWAGAREYYDYLVRMMKPRRGATTRTAASTTVTTVKTKGR